MVRAHHHLPPPQLRLPPPPSSALSPGQVPARRCCSSGVQELSHVRVGRVLPWTSPQHDHRQSTPPTTLSPGPKPALTSHLISPSHRVRMELESRRSCAGSPSDSVGAQRYVQARRSPERATSEYPACFLRLSDTRPSRHTRPPLFPRTSSDGRYSVERIRSSCSSATSPPRATRRLSSSRQTVPTERRARTSSLRGRSPGGATRQSSGSTVSQSPRRVSPEEACG